MTSFTNSAIKGYTSIWGVLVVRLSNSICGLFRTMSSHASELPVSADLDSPNFDVDFT